jgi:Na+-transporting methylmalonyl-CoA/oxaloacetate decarboxylase gamma subunit
LTRIQGVEVPNLESLDFIKVLEDKEELLKEYDSHIQEVKNLTFKNLLYTYGVVFVVLFLFILKIAIANQVYNKSISIYKMEKELEFLKVQERDIVEKIQKKRYQIEMVNVRKR